MNAQKESNRSFTTLSGPDFLLSTASMTSIRKVQTDWALTPIAERLKVIRRVRILIAKHGLRLASASASARLRPVAESLSAEVIPLLEACRFLERNAAKVLKTRKLSRFGQPMWLSGVSAEVRRDPVGVVLIIGPGNYPLLLPGVQLLQAIVAGNAVVLKPGVGGTPSAISLLALLHHAGLDSRLVQLLPEASSAAKAAIEAGPDKVIFTGSADTGEKIAESLAPQLIPATMELSGCDPAIIRADADLPMVAKALAYGLRLNNGESCIAPRRIYVARRIATEFEGLLASTLSNQVINKSTNTLSAANRTKLLSLLKEAINDGAHCIAGSVESNHFQTPLILGGVSPQSPLLKEDWFAPVMFCVTVQGDAEATIYANDCPYALGASVFTKDLAQGTALASKLRAPVVTLNDLIVPTADARLPFGGRDRSGHGVTRGPEGLLELTVPKVITTSRSRSRPAFDEAQANDAYLLNNYLTLAHGSGLRNKLRAIMNIIQHSRQKRNEEKSQ